MFHEKAMHAYNAIKLTSRNAIINTLQLQSSHGQVYASVR